MEPISEGEYPPGRPACRQRRGRGLRPRVPDCLGLRAEWVGPACLGGASGVSGGAGCGRCRGRCCPGDGRSPGRQCWWPLRAAASAPARRCFPRRRYAGERGSRRWRRHQGAQALLRVLRAPRGEGAPRGRGVGLERPGRGAPAAPYPPQEEPRALPARVPEGSLAE